MLFGVLAGARRFILLDARGETRDETRAQILSKAPLRIVAELIQECLAIAKSQAHLKRLESAVKLRGRTVAYKTGARSLDMLRIVYLRSTPSAGTLAGGAATHITGFRRRGQQELGAEIRLISNDDIAGINQKNLTLIESGIRWRYAGRFRPAEQSNFSAGALREIESSAVDLI